MVRTDHYSLKFLLDQRLTMIPQHHWVGKLLGFDFTVEYKPGAMNTMADALSRHNTEEGIVLAISAPRFDYIERLRQAQDTDPALIAIRDEITAGTRAAPWSPIDGMVAYDSRLYVPPASPLLVEIMTFFTDIVRLHGMPQSMVSDRDPVFTSKFWRELMRLMGAKLHMTTAFHPQSDGQTEAANRIIVMYLRCFTDDQPRQWLL